MKIDSSSTFHHATLLAGDDSSAKSYILGMLKDLGVGERNNPDYLTFRYETMGINEARDISSVSARKAFGGKKVIVIYPGKITLEAQNALLKTFEDPYSDTNFVLAVRDASLIIPTLRSRMFLVNLPRISHSTSLAKEFLSLSLKDKILFAKKFADEERDISIFLDNLLLLIREKGNKELLEKVYKVRLFADDVSVSSRMIIEHLSLVL